MMKDELASTHGFGSDGLHLELGCSCNTESTSHMAPRAIWSLLVD